MNKQAISVSLDPGNLVWLRAQAVSTGCRSVSEMLDQLIRRARTNGKEQEPAMRSVIGTIEIADTDPDLLTADAVVRSLFPTPLISDRKERLQNKSARHAVTKRRKRG